MRIRVSNIDSLTYEEDLYNLFDEFGDVAEVILNEEPDEGIETFSATIIMEFEEDAREAIRELNGELIDGRKLRVRDEEHALKEHRKQVSVHEKYEDELDLPEIEGQSTLKKIGLLEDSASRNKKVGKRRR